MCKNLLVNGKHLGGWFDLGWEGLLEKWEPIPVFYLHSIEAEESGELQSSGSQSQTQLPCMQSQTENNAKSHQITTSYKLNGLYSYQYIQFIMQYFFNAYSAGTVYIHVKTMA